MAQPWSERAVTVQVGAVILLAFIVISLSMYQAEVVPDQNAEVEYNHNQEVQQQLQEVRNGLVTAAKTGDEGAETVRLGTTYPSRTLFVNPPPPSGSFRTVGTRNASINVSIENGTALADDIDDYWDGSAHNLSTGALVYRPTYHVYQNGPTTVYENTLLYNVYRSANITVAGQGMVDGREITLVALGGELEANAGGTTTVDVASLSASSNTIAVTNETGSNLTLTIPTYLNETQWRDAMGAEIDGTGNAGNDAYVHGVTYQSVSGQQFNLVTLEFEQSVTYELDLARVGVGETEGIDEPNATYLTTIQGDGATVAEGQNQSLVLEVRDQYNNPVGGESVNVSADRGTVTPAAAETGTDGRVTVTYQAPSVSGTGNTDTINASFDSAVGSGVDENAPENVSFTVQIANTDGSGTGGGGGGGSAYTINWNDPDGDNPSGPLTNCDDVSCEWNVSADSDDQLDLSAGLNVSIDGFTVEFGVNDTGVGTVSPSSDSTDGSGTAQTTLTAAANGTVGVYAASGGSSDRLLVEVTNVGAGGGGGTDSPPSADFSYSPTSPRTAESITFDASVSSDDNGITSYEWDIDDDGNYEKSGQTTTHSYGDNGQKQVTLRVTDGAGQTDTIAKTVTVTNRPPSAAFDWDCTGTTCSFDGRGSSDVDGSIASYSWDFGDGGSDPGQTTSHTYTPPGTYSVTLTVTDDDGDTSSITKEIHTGGGISYGQTDTWLSSNSDIQQEFQSTRNDDVTIIAVKVNETSNQVDLLNGDNTAYAEVEIYNSSGLVGGADTTGGYVLPANMSLESDGQSAPLPSGAQQTLYLTEFFNERGSSGSYQRVDMTGRQVTITIYFRVDDVVYGVTQTVTVQ
ncbi:PKD domain-containing protein [Haloarchaeobius amylolyticus]|uniref:PKD domain-containing protein n=1 Tax=Haloarchaeobius amylolyticus TaxID=1198296 RepID=UPI0022703AC4|nr:PKD domain-containing protein [Haloarchaeobius amylolyticus]